MKKIPTEKPTGIGLCHASADDGDWAEVLPETVKALQEHLGTQQFAVLTGEEQPERWLSEVVDAFQTDKSHDLDDGCHVELGDYKGIPAVLFNDDLTAVYFARTDEPRVLEALSKEAETFERRGEHVSRESVLE